MIHVGLSLKQYAYLWTADIYDTLVYMYMYTDCKFVFPLGISLKHAIILFESKCNNLLFDFNICIQFSLLRKDRETNPWF